MNPAQPPPRSPAARARRHLRAGDLRAAAQLVTAATGGVIGITEGVHQAVRGGLGLSRGAEAGRAGGLTGQIYRAIRGIHAGVGLGVDVLLQALGPWLEASGGDNTPERAAVVAALNGVMGDRLQAMGNPLAQPMSWRVAGAPTGHALVLVHGLCMHGDQWLREGHDHGVWLARRLGATPAYLTYNTGLPVATNGRALAERLERLVASWPVPLQRLTLIGHSMGGLVIRSAVHAGESAGHAWRAPLRDLICLGTPHHGAPLERAGHGVDLLLDASPFTAPLARLGRLRSAGITDLRRGRVRGDDDGPPDAPLPLPAGVACRVVAACLAPRRGLLADRLVGDGLVPLRSALGDHDDPARALGLGPDSRFVAHCTGHLDLLGSPSVAERLRCWLEPGGS